MKIISWINDYLVDIICIIVAIALIVFATTHWGVIGFVVAVLIIIFIVAAAVSFIVSNL